jgi:Big-like domain-containing protein
MAGCAGVQSGSTPPPTVGIQLNQSTATLAPGGTQQFTATVTGSDNTAVTWTVDSVSGGNSTTGKVTSAGLYTAPESTGTHVVTATAVADTTKSASAKVTVTGALAISPATSTILAGATQLFQATLNGTTASGATWTVDGVTGGNSSVGTISAGVYTAPSQAGTHTVGASIGTGAGNNATAPVVVFSLAISPTNATVAEGETQQYTATIQGLSNTGVTWSVDSVVGGNATTGTISATGLYTAPGQTGTHMIGATSVADIAASVTTPVNISAPLGPVAISPTTATLIGGATQQFTASVPGGNPTFTWSVDGVIGGNSTVGTVTNTGLNPGLYTAPSSAGSHTVTASDGTGTGNSASAQVAVWSFTISPTITTIAPSGTQQFTATITGITNTSVTWSVDGIAGGNTSVGTVSATGLYTAPATTGAHNVTATSVAYPTDSVTARVTVVNVAQSAVLTYHNDDARDGAYLDEVTLTPSNVNPTQFGKVMSYPVDAQIYAQPLYLPQLAINGGVHDVVFIATQKNSLYAFDADATTGTGTTFWHVNFGQPVNTGDPGGPYPIAGILSTPVIDATSNTIYVVTHVEGGNPEYTLHALDVTTGKDRVTPAGISGTVQGDSLGSGCYQRMGLVLNPVTNLVYAAIGSCPSGWIFAYDKTTLQQKAIFDATPGAGGGGFWSSGGASAIDDSTGDLYLMNGTDAGDQQWIYPMSMDGYNDSFLRMDPSSLTVLDYFAPDDNAYLATNDADLGSGANILVPGSSTYPHELLGGGKDGNVFVVNRDSMGGYNNQSNNVLQTVHIGTSQFDNIFSTPVYWNDLVYFHSNGDVLRAFSWTAGAAAGQQLSSTSVANGSTVFNQHGATPSLSANGNSDAIIWEIDNSAYNTNNPSASGPAVLHAYNATNIANELYNSADAGSRDQAGLALKLTVPAIANGRVFVPTGSELDIYGLLNP